MGTKRFLRRIRLKRGGLEERRVRKQSIWGQKEDSSSSRSDTGPGGQELPFRRKKSGEKENWGTGELDSCVQRKKGQAGKVRSP